MSAIIWRKIISASISGSLFAILLALIVPNAFGESISSITDYIFTFILATPVYLMYSFPVILIYGVLTSIVSDIISNLITRKNNNKKIEVILTVIFHVFFGLILLPFSLGAAILFLITDKLIQKSNYKFNWVHSVKSLAIPCAVWLLFMGMIYLEHIFSNLKEVLV
ncbi:hypothetical protein MKZ01_08260 [Lysinibacillus endophyticus]|uniref:Uncharacterized protein n=1 Tax=Ureibacillus endophyticus TaxID=1978490 RepID=A0A494YS37_9BACL|nr:hypothetical protein [Lysinibacillus endophyticus]MCP1144596.1 hypothetical protein [Lysinibacillus endophyticus]RKQ12476.1 hypothetical protein D8M03_16895 [Lysinibacillus endophyticus]